MDLNEVKTWPDQIIIPLHNEVARGYRVHPVSKYVHTYVCSAFVFTIATTFIDSF